MKELIIDKEFKRMFLKRSDEQIQKLKESILLRGCIKPLPVWRGILLDGFDRYAICTENGIPFEVTEMAFENRSEAIEWICERQLKRDDLTLKMRIYITGKLYETQKWIKGNAGIPAKVIAKEISEKYKKGLSALSKYSRFSRTVDELADSYEDYIDDILSEKISASYGNIHKMISTAEKYVNKYAKNNASI